MFLPCGLHLKQWDARAEEDQVNVGADFVIDVAFEKRERDRSTVRPP